MADKSVVISGDADARTKALNLIMKILENDGPLKDLQLRIPVNQVTSVVGPKGSTVMSIEEETGAKVHIARRNGNEERGSAQIVGSMEQIFDAVVKVDDIVNRGDGRE
jgi:polyribonucleotide nucleotidyltransferase